MRKYHGLWLLFVFGSLLLAGAMLASCGQNTSAPDLTPRPTQLAEITVPTVTPVPVITSPAAEIPPVEFTDAACLNCHTSQDILKGLTSGQSGPSTPSSYAAWAGTVPPIEAWQRVFIDAKAYATDVHASINCTTCHGGQAVADMTAAHTGLIVNPAADPQKGCGSCHPDVVPDAVNSLHYTVAGFSTALHARSSPANYSALDAMASQQCQTCHATCSDCHVSRPPAVGSGLLAGHQFVKTPISEQTCVGCHGSRIQDEYYGLTQGLPPDVHEQAGLTCTDCHTEGEMHGTGQAAGATGLYASGVEPECESCHADKVGIGSGVLLHEIHGTEIVPCQTCHSISYTNCTGCHVTPRDSNTPSYTLASEMQGFFLGQNPLISTDRPWRYVPVRHVPVDVSSFDQYGTDLLDNFLSRPTWTFTTPHNIQLLTPQTSSCTSCHSNNDLFLTVDKVAEAERAANQQVIVSQAPALPGNWQQVMASVAQRLAEEQQAAVQPPPPAAPAEAFSSYWGVSGPAATATVPGAPSYWAGGPVIPPSTPTPAATGTPAPAATATAAPAATATPAPATTVAPGAGESTFWSASPTSTPTANISYWSSVSRPTATGTPTPAIAHNTPTPAAASNTPAPAATATPVPAASATPAPAATGTPATGESSFWGSVPEPTGTLTPEGGNFWGS
jgi:nitrate/TMAO reductase-like tetraheme cytochrome c subunit